MNDEFYANKNALEYQESYIDEKEKSQGIYLIVAHEWMRFVIKVNLISPIAYSPEVEAWEKVQQEYYEVI